MWSPHQTPAPVEKIKTKWTPENTAKTQRVVDGLKEARMLLQAIGLRNSDVTCAIEAALKRFHELDNQLVIPFL